MGKEFSFWGDREREVREDRSRWGGGGDNYDEGFSNGWREVFDRDIGEQDTLDCFLKLEVDVGVLVFGGWGILKLGAYDVSLVGGDISEDVKEVR
jgi:hypothetical protein